MPAPDSIIGKIYKLSSIEILSLGVGSPFVSEHKEMLEYRFNIKKWNHQILKSEQGNFLVQFPFFKLLEKTILLGYIDMEFFGGTFCKWSETRGMQVHAKPGLYLIKLTGLPLHLWDCEFLAGLLKDHRKIYASSRNFMFIEDISACKTLLKTKCKKDIPKVIPFRYVSPINGWLLEGKAFIDILGQPILEEVLSTKKGYEFLVYKGGPSSEFSWKDFGILWQAIELEVRHHLSSDEPPPVPSHHDPQEDAKGKRVIDNFLNSAGNEEVVKVT
ncbi:uncharacterized protein A4U43_C06F9090 [Asparagus officinalis]|uniref:DUF4283 domain-containing protein n=1 Tax=Asparagus officinalis TaxID=4686 RepID=A0A5P1EL77_ASPOF|nr:uncharacterized protein A4U43_C06F9090 [Asparagus officinalis]